MTSVPGLKPRL